ncbi:MAG TPA: response regulator [Candidatus Dormibacteraeota bacterium]|jgi:pilus assembly protein CpaE|nr:response regulator [Candidatus Dormibacteraeota bacterium]
MAEKIQVLIVDDISSTLDNLRKLLSFEDDIEVVGTAANGREAVDEAKRLHPAVVLMDVNMPEMDGIQATEVMASESPNSPVIIMSVQGERDYLRRAMQAGAREFLIKPFSGDELIASIRRVNQLEQRKETYSRGNPPAAEAAAPTEAPPEDAGPDVAAETAGATAVAVAEAPAATDGATAPPAVEPAFRAVANGELIVLYGGKGGVGKSVIAVNLACSMAKETGARVALVDLDLQFGDIGVLLNLPQTQSITDLIENVEVLDGDFVREIMAVAPNDVRVLTTPPSPELADLVTPEHVSAIFAVLKTMFDFVIVDTSSHLGDITLTALDQASRVILVTAMSIPAVKNAKLALKLFETLAIGTERITVVLNRCEAHTEFNKESIEAHLKFPIAVQIPHDPRTIINSINRGTPFAVSNPEVEASQRLRQLVGLLLPERPLTPAAEASRGRRRFGRR